MSDIRAVHKRFHIISAILICIITILGITCVVYTNQLYPWLTFSVILSISTIVLFSYFGGLHVYKYYTYIIYITIIGTFYRVIPTLLLPSVIGVDPYWYAVQTASVVEYGTIDVIQSPYYRGAPAFIVYLASGTKILGIEPEQAGIIVGIAMGMLLPLIGMAIVSQVTSGNRFATLVTGAIITVTPPLVRYALQPIAQSLAVILFALVILTLLLLVSSQPNPHLQRNLILLMIAVVTLAITHKFPIFIISILLIACYLISRYDIGIFEMNPMPAGIIVFTGVILLSVWALMTNFITETMIMAGSIISQGLMVGSSFPEPAAATQVKVDYWNIIGRNLYWFALVSIAGVSWLILFYHVVRGSYKKTTNSKITIILVCSVILVILIGVGIFGPSSVFNPKRAILLSAFVLPVVIGMSIEKIGTKRVLIAILIIGVILTQGVAFGLLPDDNNAPRSYLTSGEIEGREFITERTNDNVYTDTYYTKTITDPMNPESGYEYSDRGKYKSYDEHVFDGSFSPYEPEYIAYRTNIEIYGHLPFGGYWKLDWNPITQLNTCGDRVYDNGDTLLYEAEKCWN